MKVVRNLAAQFMSTPTSITPIGEANSAAIGTAIGCAPIMEAGQTEFAILISDPDVGIVMARMSQAAFDNFAHMLADMYGASAKPDIQANVPVTLQ